MHCGTLFPHTCLQYWRLRRLVHKHGRPLRGKNCWISWSLLLAFSQDPALQRAGLSTLPCEQVLQEIPAGTLLFLCLDDVGRRRIPNLTDKQHPTHYKKLSVARTSAQYQELLPSQKPNFLYYQNGRLKGKNTFMKRRGVRA